MLEEQRAPNPNPNPQPPNPQYQQTDDVEGGSPELFMQGLERQVDTLSPLVRVPFYDDTITRIKADALLYDEDSFSWFQAEEIPLNPNPNPKPNPSPNPDPSPSPSPSPSPNPSLSRLPTR